jgi:hypothetical protein
MVAVVASIVTIVLALVVCIINRPNQRNVAELPSPSDEVRALLSSGEKIAAMRAYRKQTSASLSEASRVIDHYKAARILSAADPSC